MKEESSISFYLYGWRDITHLVKTMTSGQRSFTGGIRQIAKSRLTLSRCEVLPTKGGQGVLQILVYVTSLQGQSGQQEYREYSRWARCSRKS
ncbi:Hypothetical protein FKW44_019846 [Caligus rogercresseyi]|uniref:Uncharacterized protein n=1 Tax=Caligus rogercresseyi TaxID=217165 RepID=A0A7T8GWH6_CALRO|nr:Hypothetical protein FKW44_019846 [Caligus rogercresseyi]